MLTLIFEVTDANEIIILTPHNGEVWVKKCSQADADFYRRRLNEEIIIRTYFNEISGKVIGTYIHLNSHHTNYNKLFYFQPTII